MTNRKGVFARRPRLQKDFVPSAGPYAGFVEKISLKTAGYVEVAEYDDRGLETGTKKVPRYEITTLWKGENTIQDISHATGLKSAFGVLEAAGAELSETDRKNMFANGFDLNDLA